MIPQPQPSSTPWLAVSNPNAQKFKLRSVGPKHLRQRIPHRHSPSSPSPSTTTAASPRQPRTHGHPNSSPVHHNQLSFPIRSDPILRFRFRLCAPPLAV
ncbi:hypothetical protein L873DRAFT_1797669 [Choiromyces venosus 120613-1]|uniref:Uncharacterized protein n=1 Tax=Choiromyces venosus 120613-1 TaxID=1336337 RepID=A0A3N4K790_9PEZI|nr:hypothetical protein L873DRAFT_1797669 [Choiromyces venosus 120613-1]